MPMLNETAGVQDDMVASLEVAIIAISVFIVAALTYRATSAFIGYPVRSISQSCNLLLIVFLFALVFDLTMHAVDYLVSGHVSKFAKVTLIFGFLAYFASGLIGSLAYICIHYIKGATKERENPEDRNA